MKGPTRRDIGLGVIVAVQLALAGAALMFALDMRRPCVNDFEGGCSYGKALAGVLAWLCALAATGVGAGAAAIARLHGRRGLMLATGGLAAGTAAGVAYGIVAMALLFAH